MTDTPTDIRTRGLQKPVDVAEYLFQRLKQIGCSSIHGVPGDFNLVALDYVPKVGLNWVGNCNELNAGTYHYAFFDSKTNSTLQLMQPTAMLVSKASLPLSQLSVSESSRP